MKNNMCKEGCCKKSCICKIIAKILVIVGGLNWGLVGLGMLLGKADAWNLVKMIFGSMPTVEAIVYLLVGIAAIMLIVGCKCKKCPGGVCSPAPEQKVEGMM
jgi:uncharacterized membrane protein YuzA (DUF378 family)